MAIDINIEGADEAKLTSLEWIETNGLGGWASGTLSGVFSRRYHGLLIAAMNPPVGRIEFLSKLAETVVTPKGNVELDSNNFNGVIHPHGYRYLKAFSKDLFPIFSYEAEGAKFTKCICMVHGENTTLIKYEIDKSSIEFTLKLKPFVSGKDYHWLSKANNDIKWSYKFDSGTLKVKPYDNLSDLYIRVDGSEFHYSPDWYYNYSYKIELERVQDFREDLFTYGEFMVKVKPGQTIYVLISTEITTDKNADLLFKNEEERKKALVKNAAKDDFLHTLLLAADQFIVRRGKDLNTIIAGYHWFADWGRDTMISLPGLCLETGRYDDARKILKAFSKVVDKGMIPNRFPDHGEEPEYNNVDGTLWYFVAIYEYLQTTSDWDFIKTELYQILTDIIDWHIKGTRYGIKVDEDGLLLSGEEGTQLTWMDAKVGDWVVTPRRGKAVEINALWYNTLKIMAEFAEKAADIKAHMKYQQMAEKAFASFNTVFINQQTGTLFDCIAPEGPDTRLRPNQLFAISLPFVLVDNGIAANILKAVEEHLLTPRGLRSLAPFEKDYKPLYMGDQLSRDGAYHQGTVWSWPIGSYLISKMKIEGKKALPKVKKWFDEFAPHFSEVGIGQISEIFDAAKPHASKGCMAQAWGVAEVLRAYQMMKKLK